jgi:hypothetical protein
MAAAIIGLEGAFVDVAIDRDIAIRVDTMSTWPIRTATRSPGLKA